MAFWKPGTVAPGAARWPARSTAAHGNSAAVELTALCAARLGLVRACTGSEVDRTTADEAIVVPYNPNAALSLSQQREQLPVFRLRMRWGGPIAGSRWPCASANASGPCCMPVRACWTPPGREIMYAIDHHSVLVVVGQTGSGKTTRAWPRRGRGPRSRVGLPK